MPRRDAARRLRLPGNILERMLANQERRIGPEDLAHRTIRLERLRFRVNNPDSIGRVAHLVSVSILNGDRPPNLKDLGSCSLITPPP